MITRHIADLLYHHECVIVPGLGGFIKANNPAWVLYSTHEFYPPSGSVAFNAGLSANDGLLANHIASADNTSHREALYEIKVWVDSALNRLKNEEKVILEGIGELFQNNSGKIEFSPAKQINFNADSFGLPVFRAKPAGTVQETIPDIQPAVRANSHSKFRHLVPETLKWAAVLAPFIAFVLWGSIKGNLIDNYVHNYTGMYSWIRSTPGKTAPVNLAPLPAGTIETPAEAIESPAGILADKNITFNPGIISYYELAKEKIYFIDDKLPGISAPESNENVNSIPDISAAVDNSNDAVLKTTPAPAAAENSVSSTNTRIPTYPWAKTITNTNTGSHVVSTIESGNIVGANPKENTKTPSVSGGNAKNAGSADKTGTKEINKNVPDAVVKAANSQGFHIIGGAFRERSNALKLIKTLEVQGYSPAIVDTTPGGLYVVSMIGFNTLKEAESKLKEIRKEGYSASWIMKKKKS